jgi:iron(II)-dependent oxidoreductase
VVTKPEVVEALEATRCRTLGILDPVPVADQARQVSSLMSPLCWDLAHIGHYEELWLIRELTDAEPTDALYDDIYDAFKHPRRERDALPILDPAGARAFDADVRKRALDVLDGIDLDPSMPLLADGFVYGMVVQHEHQHDETLLATLQLMDGFEHPDADGRAAARQSARASGLPRDVLVDGGTFTMGTSTDAWAYDNERPAHTVTIAPFRIDTTPVSNHAYLAFVDDGGYDDARHWTRDGWAWRQEAGLVAPQFWEREGTGAWSRSRFGRREDLPLDEPVQHVCWYEADAFARWSGARLPTETEWERAAEGANRTHVNLWHDDGAHRFAPDEIGSRPQGASRWGAQQLLGDVWEWTSSDFAEYPGFRSFPYREYSEVFFGPEYKVLRGGSWATHPLAMRTTFRNWDYPIRRQIFAGFRCARDA